MYERKDESKKSDFDEEKCDEELSLTLVRKIVTRGKKSDFCELKSDDVRLVRKCQTWMRKIQAKGQIWIRKV